MSSSLRSRARLFAWLGGGALLLGVALSGWAISRLTWPALPPASSTSTSTRPLPNVLVAVQDLARLESVSFHMERVIDLTEKQSRLFGLVAAEDAILLIAVADVSAGVDLSKLQPADVESDAKTRSVSVRLPAAEIFHVNFDQQHTYVHTRRTGLLARRREDLEARARAEAERALLDAAREAGILTRAHDNARRVLEGFLRSLGYEKVEVLGPR